MSYKNLNKSLLKILAEESDEEVEIPGFDDGEKKVRSVPGNKMQEDDEEEGVDVADDEDYEDDMEEDADEAALTKEYSKTEEDEEDADEYEDDMEEDADEAALTRIYTQYEDEDEEDEMDSEDEIEEDEEDMPEQDDTMADEDEVMEMDSEEEMDDEVIEGEFGDEEDEELEEGATVFNLGVGNNPTEFWSVSADGETSAKEVLAKKLKTNTANIKTLTPFDIKKLDNAGRLYEDEADSEEDDSEEEEAIIKSANESITKALSKSKISKKLQERAVAIFTAAITEAIDVRVKGIQEKMEKRQAKQYKKFVKESKKNLNKYTTYVAESWAKENKVKLEAGYKASLVENFFGDVTNMFKQYGVKTPKGQTNLVEQLQADLKKAQAQANKEARLRIDLTESLRKKAKDEVINELSEDLSELQISKLKKLCEHTAFKDEKSFAAHVKSIKQAFVTGKSAKTDNNPESKVISESKTEDNLFSQYDEYFIKD